MELNKILERDLKLACLIPTQCTGKASCSYCTSSARLRQPGPCTSARAPHSYIPPVCYLLWDAPHGLTLSPFILIMGKEMSWRGRKKEENKIKRDFYPAVTFWGDVCVSAPSLTHGDRGDLALPDSSPAFITQDCLAVISEWSAVWMSHIQELTFRVLLILVEILLLNNPVQYCLTLAYLKSFFTSLWKDLIFPFKWPPNIV